MRAEAAVVRAPGAPLVITELELAEPGPGEVLVRLVATGVAACDVAAASGRSAVSLPFVPGCEGAGIVERVGDGVATPAAGQAVVVVATLPGMLSDGAAPLTGVEGPVHGGFGGQSSFATHLLCAANLAVPVADEAPLELLAGLGHEVSAGAGLVLRTLGEERVATVVVTGADAVGLGACMAAAALGVERVILADPRAARRELALGLGATVAVPTDAGLAAAVKGLDAEGARYAFETSGAPAALVGCEASLSPDGRCIRADAAPAGSVDVLPRLAAMVASGALPMEKLVTFFPFEAADEALAALESGDAAKPVLRFPLGPFGELDRALQAAAAIDTPAVDETADAPAREAPPVTA